MDNFSCGILAPNHLYAQHENADLQQIGQGFFQDAFLGARHGFQLIADLQHPALFLFQQGF